MKQHFCTTHSNNYVVLEQVIIEELKTKCKEYIYKEKIKSNVLKNIDKNNKIVEKYINKFLNMKNPSRELIVNLIDRIDIYEDKTINVKVTFTNL